MDIAATLASIVAVLLAWMSTSPTGSVMLPISLSWITALVRVSTILVDSDPPPLTAMPLSLLTATETATATDEAFTLPSSRALTTTSPPLTTL